MIGCIFCRIVERKVKADIIYEDDDIIAINDINPQAPTHILIMPKEHIPTIEEASPEMIGKLISQAGQIAREVGISQKGYRTVINCRERAGQSINHLHVHLLGGRWFSWPPG